MRNVKMISKKMASDCLEHTKAMKPPGEAGSVAVPLANRHKSQNTSMSQKLVFCYMFVFTNLYLSVPGLVILRFLMYSWSLQ